jgi:predicted  nucleic acid-binding Zn-ribbon protein
MNPDLERLLDLQARDLSLLETDLRLKTLLDQLAGLDAALEQARSDIGTARSRVAESVRKREELEKSIETQRARQEQRRSRMEQVRTAREVQALMAEMDLARADAAKQESEWVKMAEQVQQQEAGIREAEERVKTLESDQGGERARLEAAAAELQAERATAQKARDDIAATISRPVRQRYDRLWAARTAVVVVPLRGDACAACNTAVPRNRRSQIRAGTVIEACEACGAILYHPNGEP